MHDATPLLTPEAVANRLGVTPNYLNKLRCWGTGPVYRRISPKIIRYDQADVDAWLADRRRTSTSDAGRAA